MIPVFKPSIKRKDMDGVLTCLVSDSIGFGEKTREFVHMVSSYLEAEEGLGFRDYSVALSVALDLLDLDKGSSIIISPLSPGFYFDVITRRGFGVLYADINPLNGCMDPRSVEKLHEKKPAAVLLHFPLGFIPDLESFRDIGIPVIMDISTAFGGTYKGTPFGKTGDVLVMNLEEEGIITAGGGALVLSGEKKYSSKLQKIDRDASSFLTDFSASLGTNQFHQLDSFLEKRKAIDEIFQVSLMKGRHGRLHQGDDGENIPFSFPVLLEGNVQDVRQYARKKGISTAAAFEKVSFMQHHLDDFPCPNAVSIVKRSILFPLYPSLSRKNIEMIAKVLTTLP